MKNNFKKLIFFLLLLPLTFSYQSCDKENLEDVLDYVLAILNKTGWLENKEEMNNIPEDITPLNDDTGNLEASISLEDKFPPIGNQGSYGTCVVWSVGYNLKTALNAIEKGWTSTELSQTSNQTSPKNLWFNIPSGEKGSSCEGTNFEPALDALISSGAESMSAAPYTNLGNCSGTGLGNTNNKLANYRKIASKTETESLTVTNFKNYLNAGRPIAIGAQLGDKFMDWSSSSVISTDTYNNPGMQHAYHAMVLVGYDDNKGTNGAFRVRNSWGTSWGDQGSIWVDYNFFCNSFCFAAFVAQNVNSVSASSGSISSSDLSSGYDLLAYDAIDFDDTSSTNPTSRIFTYDVFNSGNQTISSSEKWTVTYVLYNAVDGKDYQIIYDDYYTDEGVEKDSILENPNSTALFGGYLNNITVAPGENAGEGYEMSYTMPSDINGKYYLVIMADAYNKISEVNEDNNFFFITGANAKPLEFVNGVAGNMPKRSQVAAKSSKRPTLFSNTTTQTVVKPGNLNAYTPSEIKTMLLHDKKTGKLDAKIKAFRTKGGNKGIKKVRR